jgi:hypothetical protein
VNQEQRDLIITWGKKVRATAKAHCQASVRDERNNLWLGVPVVVLTTIVGTSVFATLQKQPHVAIQILIGLTSLLAAVLASLQTFLQFSQRSVKHREAAVKFEALQKQLEQLTVFPIEDEEQLGEKLAEFRTLYQDLSMSSPNVQERIWTAALEYVEQQDMKCPDV